MTNQNEHEDNEMFAIGGTVWGDQQPLANASVQLQGKQVTTEKDGRFRFHRLSPGVYTLQVRVNGRSQQMEIVLPPPRGDEEEKDKHYDFQI